MIIKEFDPVIYPMKLIISIGMDYEDLSNRFINRHSDDGLFEKNNENFVSWVTDKQDDICFKTLWFFKDNESFDFRTICHESFHVAIEYLSYHNMQMGYEVGQDEHAAYIAGWAGDCASQMYPLMKEENDNKENNIIKER